MCLVCYRGYLGIDRSDSGNTDMGGPGLVCLPPLVTQPECLKIGRDHQQKIERPANPSPNQPRFSGVIFTCGVSLFGHHAPTRSNYGPPHDNVDLLYNVLVIRKQSFGLGVVAKQLEAGAIESEFLDH